MQDRDILIAGLDISLALLIVFMLSFLAIRYDESIGPHSELTALVLVEESKSGNVSSNQFLGIRLSGSSIILSEAQGNSWSPIVDISGDGWQGRLRAHLASSDLPIVVYEDLQSSILGDVVREAVVAGRHIGLRVAK